MADEKLKKSLQRLYRDWLVDCDPSAEVSHYNLTPAQRRRVMEIIQELKLRSQESLSIYKPLSHLAPFHECRAPEVVVRGSNRGGKTVASAVEFARAVTGQDPFGKYPVKDGRALICGKDGRHNAEVIYRKLFRFGCFKMIEKQHAGSGKWEAFIPSRKDHKARESEAKPAPPLIPPRFIKSIAWENKKESSPRLVTLTNGWEILFASSQGKPPQGIDVDLVWFDEEITDSEWYPEMTARLIDRSGRFIWSATAQLGGVQLFELCEKAALQRSQPNPTTIEFFAHIDDNHTFTEEQRELFFAKLTPEQRRIRIEGEFAFTSTLVWPEFSEYVHGIDWFDIPRDWTRYMITDPGRQVCAVLFVAVPPPTHKLAGHALAYDELYMTNCNAEMYGRQVGQKAAGQNFHAFVIDHSGSGKHDIGGGANIEQQYAMALRKNGVKSFKTGYGFIWGSSDVDAGLEKFRSWLLVRESGLPKFLYFKDKLMNFKWEITRYRYAKQTARGGQPKPEKLHDHLMDCARYVAMYDPQWHKPKRRVTANRLLKYVNEKLKKNATEGGIRLGPGVAAEQGAK